MQRGRRVPLSVVSTLVLAMARWGAVVRPAGGLADLDDADTVVERSYWDQEWDTRPPARYIEAAGGVLLAAGATGSGVLSAAATTL